MFEWLKEHKYKIISLIIIVIIILIYILPMIIEKIFMINAINDFFVVSYDIETVLGFYGDVLVLIGTVSLGAMTLIQNHISQQKTDEVNRLTLELQRQSMVIAEERYSEAERVNILKYSPKFSLVTRSSNGNYKNLVAEITNTSKMLLSNFKSLSFTVINTEKKILTFF